MRPIIVLLFLFFIAYLPNAWGQTNVSGTINTTTWTKAKSPYILTESITVPAGQTLTIEPGVEIHSKDYSDLFTINGTLKAIGTTADSIRFKGFANPGLSSSSTHGGILRFTESSVNSRLEYISMDMWGDENYYNSYSYGYNSAIDIRTTGVTIINSTIRNSENYGIRIRDESATPTISNNTYVNNPKDIGGSINNCANITENSSLRIYLSGSTNKNDRLKKLTSNSYYVLDENIYINNTITIDPGVEIRSYKGFNEFNVNGTLIAKGTPQDSIRFIGFANPSNPGNSSHGGSIVFNSQSLSSQLEYVVIDKWGDETYTDGAVSIQSSSVSITKCTIKNSEEIAIFFASTVPTIQNNTFYNNPIAIRGFPMNFGKVSNNTGAKIELIGNNFITANTTWPFPGPNSYYSLLSYVYVYQNFTLTIEAGTTIETDSYVDFLSIAGTLKAKGTKAAPIRIVGNGIPNIYGLGGGIILESTSTNSELNYVTFEKQNNIYSNSQALYLGTSNVSLSNINIINSPNYGLYYDASGSPPTITNSKFNNNKTGIHVARGRPKFDNCEILGNTEFGINNVSTASADTVDARNCYWGDVSGPLHPTLNPTGKGNKVSNKVKFRPVKTDPIDGAAADIGAFDIVAPVSDCNLKDTTRVTVKIKNYGNVTVNSFSVSYQANAGTAVTETVTQALSPGATLDYTFNQRLNLSAVGIYSLRAFTQLSSDTVTTNNSTTKSVEHYPAVAVPTNLQPAANATGIDIPPTFSWSSVLNATSYDLYLWNASNAEPTAPSWSDLPQPTYIAYNYNFIYGNQYRWKVVAKRAGCRSASSIQTFTIRQLPDLIVEDVIVPATAFSETDIEIRYTVKNQGTGGTGTNGWYETVYLSDQPTLTGQNQYYLGTFSNQSALAPNQSYTTANFRYRLPQGIKGSFYVIVQTNNGKSVIENDYTNNAKSKAFTITLTPPPDLQVTSLVGPQVLQNSEDSISVSYSVKNEGTGPTTATYWVDQVYLSKSSTFSASNSTLLFYYTRTQALSAGASYTVNKRIKLPANISGEHYLHAITDAYNYVFEDTKEANNTSTSTPFSILLRPQPNLIVSSIQIGVDTVSNGQPVTVQWTTENKGSFPAIAPWREETYLSTTTTFNQNNAQWVGSYNRTTNLNSLSSSGAQQSIPIPTTLPEGTYRFFVKTDATNLINENTEENDNVSGASGPVFVANPDLIPSILNAPSTAISEQTIAIKWKVKNRSRGTVFNNSWTDRIYLSTNITLDGSDLLLNSVALNQLLTAEGEYTRQLSVTLPEGKAGNYYLIVRTDDSFNVFEKSEANNTAIQAITISLAPGADLQVNTIVAPALDTAGTSIKLKYTLKNAGTGTITNRNWTDYVYLSRTQSTSTANLITLGSVSQSRTLLSNQSVVQEAIFNLPSTLDSGQYYVMVQTDIDNRIFENTNEGNNTADSPTATFVRVLKKLIVTPPTPIDLGVMGGEVLSSSIVAGQPINIRWNVKNNSSSATVAPSWKDAIYLSSDAVYDTTDQLLSTFTISAPVAAGATYTQTASVTIPPTTPERVYILVYTDRENKNNDNVLGNNTLPINSGSNGQAPVTITIPPPADLYIESFASAQEGKVSQPVSISFKVKNIGTGPTPGKAWSDQIYLSTDNVLSSNDVFLGNFAQNEALAAGASYTVTGQVFLPTNVAAGFYNLLLKTDANDNVFERNQENNNIAISNLQITQQFPSDLVVREIMVPPTEQLAGTNTTIRWKLRNTGSNPASGFLRQAVYFSKDSTIDANDVLFGLLDQTIYLSTNATADLSMTKSLSNISMGDYYVIVKADLLNNITESNENNNQTTAVGKLTVNVKILVINVLTPDTLVKDQPVYYRIVVPPNLVNETLQIDLKADSSGNVASRLFVSYDKVPAPNDADFSANLPFRAGQRITIPQLKEGTYYLTALGESSTQPKQPATLLAQIIPFSVTGITANQGGNTGSVTVKITGAKFNSATVFKLQKSGEVIFSKKIYFINPALAYVTFDLTNKALGVYEVAASNSATETTTLPNGFTIVKGPSSSFGGGSSGFVCSISNVGFDEQLETTIEAPASARLNQITSFIVNYKNISSVDIPIQTRFLLSVNENVPIGFSAVELKDNKQDLVLVCEDKDGPPGILRPGANGYFKIYAMSKNRVIPSIDVTITE